MSQFFTVADHVLVIVSAFAWPVAIFLCWRIVINFDKRLDRIEKSLRLPPDDKDKKP